MSTRSFLGSTVTLHTFSLAALLYFYSLPVTAQTINSLNVVRDGSPARYFKGTVPPSGSWSAADFNDGRWLDGHVPLGYGESLVVAPEWTVLNDMQNEYLTAYVRIPFFVDPRYRVHALSIRVIYDDGIVVYLNGVEIGRGSLPGGRIAFDTPAMAHEHLAAPLSLMLNSPDSLNGLRQGRNVLAIEIHNQSISSSDLVLQPTVTAVASEGRTSRFVRGADCDETPTLNIADPIRLLRWTFLGTRAPDCTKACDLNDDGQVDPSDAVFALRYLFLSGDPPPAPFPLEGDDPTKDDLVCDQLARRPAGR